MSAAQPKPTETKPSEPSMEEILASIRRIISDDQATRPAAKAGEPEPAAKVEPPARVEPAPAAKIEAAPPAIPASPAPIARTVEPEPMPLPPPPPMEDDEEILELSPKASREERKREPHFITDDVVGGDVSFDGPTPAAEPARDQDDVDAMMSQTFAAASAEPEPEPAPIPAMSPQPEFEPEPSRLLSPSTDRVVSSAFNSLANTVLSNNARTLDDLVHEMLRPLIKSWLDENLPTVVERLVRAEIERVARGGR